MSLVEKGAKPVFVVIIIVLLLYLASLFNYLLFHTLAEFFSICIAITVFLITWNSARLLQNNYLLVVGFAYLFIGILDLFHTLSYKGMMIFTDYDYHANQVWIAARYFESIILLISFILLKSKKHVNSYVLFAVYSIITTLVLFSVFVWHSFPICYIEGVGQTPFKVISEYIIIAILITAIFILIKNKDCFDRQVYRMLLLSLICTATSEFCFSTYINNYGFSNLLGHYFKIASFYFIYRSIIHTGIKEPYNLIFREMKQTEQQLYEQNTSLSNKAIADGLTIREHIALLQQQYQILNRQSMMLNLSQEAIFAWDLYGTIFYWNKGAELMYGFTPEEAIGQISDDLLKTKRIIKLETTREYLKSNGFWNGEIEQTTKDGRQLLVDSAHQLYRDEDGRDIVLEICHDVTERNKMEKDLRYQSMLRYTIIENMHDALFVYDSEGNITLINACAREMYPNHFNENTSVKNVFEEYQCYSLDRQPLSVEDYPTRRAFRGESISNERIIIEGDHWSRIIEVNATPIVDLHNEILAIVVCHHDISEMIKRQQAIEENVIQLQQQNKVLNRQAKLLDLSNEAIFTWYMDGPIIYWNQGAEKMYGFKDDEAVGCFSHKLLNARYPFDYEELKNTLLENGTWSGFIENIDKDGRLRIIETRMQLIRNDTGLNTVLETNRDVTERIKAENAIKKSTLELKNIINSTYDFIWSVDTEYRVILCNKAVYDFTKEHYGIEMEPGFPFFDFIPPENASAFREFFERVRSDGEFHVDMQSFRGNKFIAYSFHPVYVDSELVEITVFGRDISDRIKAEQEIIKLNASLESRINDRTKELQQSLETIKTFSMTMTHDLKMPLQEIGILSKYIQNEYDIRENAVRIDELCIDMGAMLSQLIEYNKVTEADIRKETVDLAKMITEIFDELKTDHSEIEFQTGLPKARADRALIRRVITNLLSNALKFSSKRKTAKITVGCKNENNEYIFFIKDNGIGINMAYADKLFKVFERLDDAGEYDGHGLGLASVRSIIEKHGGRTWINGKVNVGTTVYFTLPVDHDGEN